MSLVPIPWEPSLFLMPETLALLEAAGKKRGATLHVRQPDGAWRSYYTQKYYFEGWKARKPGFNPASDPDVGFRQHMRGAAFDLINIDAATQAACRAVGLVRDGVEAWHWNHPNWANMPIVKTNTSTAGSGGTPIVEDDMSAAAEEQIKWLYDQFSATAGPGYRNFDVVMSGAKAAGELRNSVLNPGGFAGDNRPLDVLLTHATTTLPLVKEILAKQGAVVITDAQLDAIATKVVTKLGTTKAPTKEELAAAVMAAIKAQANK
jgi:hypothetical protein